MMNRILTHEERSLAYGEIERRFELTHHDRVALDRSPFYSAVMTAAVARSWQQVELLLGEIKAGTDR